jgi:D-alanyl-D-alanine carboxypeptidase
MPRAVPRLALVCAVFACAGCGASSTNSGSADAQRALRVALDHLVATPGGPPGAIALVQHGDVTTVITAGTAIAGTSTPIRATDHVRIASVSKAFSAAAALGLVAKGKLSLDDTIGQELPGLPKDWASVNLEELLHHTSGVPDFSGSPSFQQAVSASLESPPPPEQLLSYVAGDPLRFAPGSRYEYSNSDNVIVGLMIQAVTGRAYDTALSQIVYKPLGLTQTSLPATVSMPDPFVHGYASEPSGSDDGVSQVLAPGWAWASGGIVSTPSDVNRFVRAYVRGATTNARTRARQFQFVSGDSEPPGPGTNAAGLGIFRYSTGCGTVYGHTGNTIGYTQFMAASANGANSVSMTVNTQISGSTNEALLPQLRHVFELGVCAALS